jgi:iron complex outermembrane receptor protein
MKNYIGRGADARLSGLPGGGSVQSSPARLKRRDVAVKVVLACLSVLPVWPAAADEPQDVAKDANSSSATASGEPKLAEVVVTGTLIRGIAPAGANVVTVDADTIAATAATGSDSLLNNTIPQLS